MINIVTLTYVRDLRQTVLQAESIQKYVSPCIHYVIITSNFVSPSQKRRWYRILKPYYTRHKLVLLFLGEQDYDSELPMSLNSNYYYSFVYQFTVAEILDDDYLVLNAKNFFISPVNLEDYRGISGNMSLNYIKDERLSNIEGVKSFCEFLKKPLPETLLGSFTPVMVNRKTVIDTLGNFSDFKKMWSEWSIKGSLNKDYAISDWHFYSLLIGQDEILKQHENPNRTWYFGIWSNTVHEKGVFYTLKKILADDSIKVMGIHKHCLKDWESLVLTLVNKLLTDRGFKTRLKRLYTI